MTILLTIAAALFSLFGVVAGSLGLAALPLVLVAVFWFLRTVDDTDDVFNGKR